MKKKINKLFFTITLAILFGSCTKKEEIKPETSKIPTNFSIDIPNSLSPDGISAGKRISTNLRLSASDTLFDGEVIYEGIRGYIKVGEIGAKIVTEIMKVARVAVGFNVTSVVYLGEEDQRIKRMTLSQNASYLSKNYAYKLKITDSLSGNIGIEVYWNTNPIVGIAVLSPYVLDKNTENSKNPNALIRVDYSENGNLGYEKQMTVYVTGMTTTTPGDFNNLKMFVGLKGNIVDVHGNSNHPNVDLFDLGNVNYAFRAKSNIALDIAVAQVILPPSTVTSLSLADIETKYFVKNVISNWAIVQYPALGTVEGLYFLNKYLKNTNAPGFFVANQGFVKAETPPVGYDFSTDLTDLSNLEFYVPNDIKNLSIGFSE